MYIFIHIIVIELNQYEFFFSSEHLEYVVPHYLEEELNTSKNIQIIKLFHSYCKNESAEETHEE